MQDSFGRNINYMRISLTDRCNYACYYCKPDISKHLCHSDILTYEQLLDICRCAITLGITRFKITGGEPTLRKGYIDFIRRLKELDGVEQVTLTTNGSLFSFTDLDELKKIGLDCINFSIDTLDESEYLKICKKNNLKKVLSNLEYAYQIGIFVKVNCVVDNLFSLSRFESMLELIKDKKIALRYIELMPLKYSDRNTKMNELIEILSGICSGEGFENSEDLIADGFLDSLDIVQVSAELENNFDIEITPVDVTRDNFKSVNSIYEMIKRLEQE